MAAEISSNFPPAPSEALPAEMIDRIADLYPKLSPVPADAVSSEVTEIIIP